MSLFAGVWQRAGGKVAEGTATGLMAALHAPFHRVFSALEDGPLVFAARALERPAIVSHSGIIAALSGRLDDDLHAEDVLDAYMGSAHDSFQHISGDYAIAVYDPRKQTLILLRDPVGTQPLYYAASDDGLFAFGSQIKAVITGARLQPRPNRAALAQLLVKGEGVPRGETCFSGVYSLPPGRALFVTHESLAAVSHVDLRPIAATPLRTFAESAAAFRHAFVRSVDRRLSRNGATAVFLSGGVDSSALTAVAAREAGCDRVLAVSYGCDDESCADERGYVNSVVEHCKVRSVRLPLQPVEYAARLDAAVWASELPSVLDVPGTLHRAAKAARNAGAHTVLMGTWADQVLFPFPPPYLSELLRSRHIRTFRKIADEITHWHADVDARELHRAFLKQAIRTFVPPAILDRLRPVRREDSEVFDGLPVGRMTRRKPAISYAAAVRQEVTGPRPVSLVESATKWAQAEGVALQLPYLDADLLQLLMAVPAAHALHEGRPKALLRSGLESILPEAIVARRDKGDYTSPIYEGIACDWNECVDRLEGARRLVHHGLMSEDAARTTMAKLRRPEQIAPATTDRLATLAAVEAWLRTFFDNAAGQTYA